MLYNFKLTEDEIRTINAALDHAAKWADDGLLASKAIDKLKSYIRDEIEAQTKYEANKLLEELKK
jgi:hypothetical protein